MRTPNLERTTSFKNNSFETLRLQSESMVTCKCVQLQDAMHTSHQQAKSKPRNEQAIPIAIHHDLQLITMPARPLAPSHEPTSMNTHPKINQHNHHKTHTDDRGAPFLIINTLDIAAFPDLVYAPDVQE